MGTMGVRRERTPRGYPSRRRVWNPGASPATTSRRRHMPISTEALQAPESGAPFERTTIDRRDPGPGDVEIEIKHCGICHSDIHQAQGDWGAGIFPMVHGHEIAGVVASVGSDVEKFSEGDRVGVGCFIDS